MNHEELDQRSLALHQLVIARVERDPSLLARAQTTLARWQKTSSVRTQPALLQWAKVLAQGLKAVKQAALLQDDEGQNLRQSSPLACLLTPRERWDFLKNWKAAHPHGT